MPDARSAWLQPEQMGKTARDWSDITKGATKQFLPGHHHPHHLHALQQAQQHQRLLANGLLAMFPVMPVMIVPNPAHLRHNTHQPHHPQAYKYRDVKQAPVGNLAVGSSIRHFGGTPWRDSARRYNSGIVGILGRIIRIADDVVSYRLWVEKGYGESPKGLSSGASNTKSYASIVSMTTSKHHDHGLSSCGSSTASSSSFDNRSVSSRDSAASSIGDSDTESELAMTSSATVRVPHHSPGPATLPAHCTPDRPGSAPPTGLHRPPVTTKDASVQSEPVLLPSEDPDDDNVSEANSIRSARSQPDEIKVVSYNDPIIPAAGSTRSLDGNLNYRGAVLKPGQHLQPPPGPTRGQPAPPRGPATYRRGGGPGPQRMYQEYEEWNYPRNGGGQRQRKGGRGGGQGTPRGRYNGAYRS